MLESWSVNVWFSLSSQPDVECVFVLSSCCVFTFSTSWRTVYWCLASLWNSSLGCRSEIDEDDSEGEDNSDEDGND